MRRRLGLELQRLYVLSGHFLGDLAGPLLGDLDGLLGLVLDGLPLDRGAKRLRPRVVVALQVRAARETVGMIGEEVIEGSLELNLLQTLIAVGASAYALASIADDKGRHDQASTRRGRDAQMDMS